MTVGSSPYFLIGATLDMDPIRFCARHQAVKPHDARLRPQEP